MNKRKLSLIATVFLIAFFGISHAFAYVETTIGKYEHAAPCGRLTGFAGLLQAANFIPSGGCIVDVKKDGCHDRRACTITHPPSGKTTKGHCTPTENEKSCFCLADERDDSGDRD